MGRTSFVLPVISMKSLLLSLFISQPALVVAETLTALPNHLPMELEGLVADVHVGVRAGSRVTLFRIIELGNKVTSLPIQPLISCARVLQAKKDEGPCHTLTVEIPAALEERFSGLKNGCKIQIMLDATCREADGNISRSNANVFE